MINESSTTISRVSALSEIEVPQAWSNFTWEDWYTAFGSVDPDHSYDVTAILPCPRYPGTNNLAARGVRDGSMLILTPQTIAGLAKKGVTLIGNIRKQPFSYVDYFNTRTRNYCGVEAEETPSWQAEPVAYIKWKSDRILLPLSLLVCPFADPMCADILPDDMRVKLSEGSLGLGL